MARFGKILIFTAAVLFLWGCSPQETAQPPHVGVQILVQDEKNRPLRQYTQPEKLQKVLLKLRTLGYTGLPETDPEGLPGETLTLQVRLADGSDAVYQLRRGLYFHRDDRPWKKIDPERAAELESLLQNLPGDELPTAAVFPSPGRIIPDFSS